MKWSPILRVPAKSKDGVPEPDFSCTRTDVLQFVHLYVFLPVTLRESVRAGLLAPAKVAWL